MTIANLPIAPTLPIQGPVSAVSWQAIIAGAFVSAAVMFVLVALGAGFGLSSVSPWPRAGASATTFTVITAIWLIVVQWLAMAIGGYLTGRLRVRWIGLHTHEVAFRDTAHGFLMWALATVIGAMLLSSAAGSLIGGGVRAAATVAGGAAQGATTQGTPSAGAYAIDGLFRSTDPTNESTVTADNRAEAGRILAAGAANGSLSTEDRTYLASLVAARTGVSTDDAQKRVDAAMAREKAAADKARAAADKARKTAATAAIFLAVSMLVGAFIASAAAALGGLRRDEHA